MIKERPIIFSTDMVKAILEGRKTQTRRVITPQPTMPNSIYLSGNNWAFDKGTIDVAVQFRKCPYGQVGDRLWVRESWYWNCVNPIESEPLEDRKSFVSYRADGEFSEQFQNWQKDDKWRPAIHMPHWASRITLEIAEVRVERLQEIIGRDLFAEGIERRPLTDITYVGDSCLFARQDFIQLWDSLNAKRGYGWEVNPWVWVISFKRVNNG